MEAILNANEASQRYNLVLEAGRIPYMELQHSLAAAERQAALDARADIAVQDMFAEAESVFNEAVRGLETQDYEGTTKEFIHAGTLFAAAGAAASEKRRTAADAIREAEEIIDEVIQNARQAETPDKDPATGATQDKDPVTTEATQDKRRIAAEAIREAEEIINEVIQNARQAELNIGGGDK
jgi:hydroxymethylpyrimidine/phosphomethylpyrimidine kinase